MPRWNAAWTRISFAIGLTVSGEASAAWTQLDSSLYEAVSLDVGITSASRKLCEVNEVQQVMSGDAIDFGTSDCEGEFKKILAQLFDDDICHEGGLYATALEACVDAILGNFDDHHLHCLDASIVVPSWSDVVSEHCSPNDVCRPPAALSSALEP